MLDARTGKIVNYRITLIIVYIKIEHLHIICILLFKYY